jgi:hypothetical protein
LLLNKVIRFTIEGLELRLGFGAKAGLGVIRPCYYYCSITFIVYSYIDYY